MIQDTAILLVNMGSPRSEKEMKSFLQAMFNDKAIIPLAPIGRFIFSRLVSSIRYKASWSKYKRIGGSDLMTSTETCAQALSALMGKNVFTAYSYVTPSIHEQMQDIKQKGYKDITVISMYPQDSHTTTASVKADVKKAQKQTRFNKVLFAPAYATSATFISYWAKIVRKHMEQHQVENCLLLCSAHSIPVSRVKSGDNYPDIVNKMSQLLAQELQLKYKVTYQSQVGPQKWLEPRVTEHVETLIKESHDKIIILPISFTTECLETEYDLSIEIVNQYKHDKRIQHISRVYLPIAHPLFIQTLKESIDAAQ